MQLYYTPCSHFSRKVRILLTSLGIDAELVDVGDAAETNPERFGGNPLMTIPVLRDSELVVYGSDEIAQHLVRRYDPADRFCVLAHDVRRLNTRAVMNGVMSAEAELILAARTGLDTHAHLRFDKKRQAIAAGLVWLETHADAVPAIPDYAAFHLASLWDHLVMFRNLPDIALPNLAARIADIHQLPMVAASRPLP